MSTSFIITPYDPKAWEDPDDHSQKPTSDLKIWREQLRTALFNHWTDGRCSEEYISWLLYNDRDAQERLDHRLRLYLHSDHQVVSFNPAPKFVFLEFVLWYREYIPEEYPLYLFNSTSFERILLTGQTTERDIVAFFGIQE